MAEVYELEFKGGRKDFYLNSQNIPLRIGDLVVVQADRGEDVARVAQIAELSACRKREAKREILRRLTPEDMEKLKQNMQKEKEAIRLCKEKIAEHGLKMKLVDAEYQFDGSRICFYFTAEKRVDFRQLVKDMADIYRTRVEMRQIGVREEARRLSGYGPCGRKLCCDTFLVDFEPISVKMAKDQGLSPSSTKISGVCGRLMCCLLYEEDFYKEALKRFPKVGTKISVEGKSFQVTENALLKDMVYLKDAEGTELKLPLDKVTQLQKLSESKRPLKRLFGSRKSETKGRKKEARTRS
ncbi:MAG TPA: hypothetical protein ENF86_01460 [Firmicutes bacterium]|nr:hypothetical protein [Bacillota bacterium]